MKPIELSKAAENVIESKYIPLKIPVPLVHTGEAISVLPNENIHRMDTFIPKGRICMN
jgi:hypothetical protein